MKLGGRTFSAIWTINFDGPSVEDATVPLCLVARRFHDGRTLRFSCDELRETRTAPFQFDAGALLITFRADTAAAGFLAFHWPMPANLLDLFVEFRNVTNGRQALCGNGLMGALASFGLDAQAGTLRSHDIGDPHRSAQSRLKQLDRCEQRVLSIEKLFVRMLDQIDLPRALLRGRYMIAVARMESIGAPVDVPTYVRIRDHWSTIQNRLIERVDAEYGVFERGKLIPARWERWLVARGIPWPRLPNGALALDDDTFRDMARESPAVALIRELRVSLSQLDPSELVIDSDGRNRCDLSPFASVTGRNQPSSNKFIFGPAVWIRGLIRPEPGRAIAYIDWCQQEFGIAAALSSDLAMLRAYESGDPYLAFAKQAGAVPEDGTKSSHAAQRERFKACALGVQYGMGADALASRIGQAPIYASELLRQHRQTYRRFWDWSEAAVSYGLLHGELYTAFGWRVHVTCATNPRMLANFPMQANGAEMLRLACFGLTERGIRTCAPVHDAILIEAPTSEIGQAVHEARQLMSDASAAVLGGFRLRTEAKVFAWPARYADPRGERMWDAVQAILNELDDPETCSAGAWGGEFDVDDGCCARTQGTCARALTPSNLIFVSKEEVSL